MARTPNLEKLTYVQLVSLQERIEAAIAERKSEDARAVKQQIQALAAKSGFSMAELFGGGDRRKGNRGPSTIKYRNPKDAAQTWTGRGRRPHWIVNELKRGAKLESFTV